MLNAFSCRFSLIRVLITLLYHTEGAFSPSVQYIFATIILNAWMTMNVYVCLFVSQAMVSCQMLSELEEVIQYKLVPERRDIIRETWWERLQVTTVHDIWKHTHTHVCNYICNVKQMLERLLLLMGNITNQTPYLHTKTHTLIPQ